MLSRVDAVAVTETVFFVSVSMLLKLIPSRHRLVSAEPGKRDQLEWHVDLVMLFLRCERCVIAGKIDSGVKGFCSLLHYVVVVVGLIFLQLFTSAVIGNVSITIYTMSLSRSKTIRDNLSLKLFLLITTLIVDQLMERRWR